MGQVEAALDPGQAEVGDPELAGPVDHQVRGLDVAMQHVAGVGMVERFGRLPGEPGHLAGERVSLGGPKPEIRRMRGDRPRVASKSCTTQVADDPGQVAAVDESHRVIGHASGRSRGKDGHDVRMVQAGGGLRLDLEPLEMPRVERRGAGQDLQGDPPAQRDLHRLVDDAHAAPAHLADQPEVTQVAKLGEDCSTGRGRSAIILIVGRRSRSVCGVSGVVLQANILAPPQPLADLGDELREFGVVRSRPGVPARSWHRLRIVGLHDGADPLDGPEMPHLGRALADLEDRGDLGEGQILQVAHHQDLAIGRRQSLQRIMDPLPALLPDQGMSRRRVAGDQAIDQQAGRVIGPGEGVFLAADAPGPGSMLPVHSRQPLGRQAVQPRVERQRAISLVVGQLPRSVNKCLLDNVRGIHPGRQSRVQPQCHHPPQSLPMPLQQAAQRRLISARGIAEQDDPFHPDPWAVSRPSRISPVCILPEAASSSQRFLHSPPRKASHQRPSELPVVTRSTILEFFVTISCCEQDFFWSVVPLTVIPNREDAAKGDHSVDSRLAKGK